MKKLIAAITTGLIAVALVLVGAAAPSSANNGYGDNAKASISGSAVCTTATGAAVVTWSIDNQSSHTVTVTDVGSSPTSVTPPSTINGNHTATFTQDIPAPAGGVTASVTLSFKWSDGETQGNTTKTVKVSNDCVVPPKADASATIIDTPATCGAGETVAEGTIANATWTKSDTTGHYDLEATADPGYTFAIASPGGSLNHDKTVETFSGYLAYPTDPSDCKFAAAALSFTQASCVAPETVAEGAVTDATWTTFTTTATSYHAVATATSGFEFSNGNTTMSFSGSLAIQVAGHPCEDYMVVAWTMYGWNGPNNAVFTPPQKYFTSEEVSTTTDNPVNVLDSQLLLVCGMQYQVDVYYNSTTTGTLINAGYLYASNQGGTATKNEDLHEDLIPGTWGSAYKVIQTPPCAIPATPTETDTCANGGTITIMPADGVVYYVNGDAVDTSGGTAYVHVGDGTATVTAVAQTGYLLKDYEGPWSFKIDTDCTATYNSSGDCSYSNGNSTETVTLTLDNPSDTDATFVVTSGDSTVNTPNTYIVAAGTSENVVVGSTGTSGGTFDVSINGGDAIEVAVDSFDGCIPTEAGDPSVTEATCNGDNNTANDDASITVDLEEGLSYTITGPAGFTTLTDITGTGGDTVVATGIPAGDYVVSVTALPGYSLDLSDPDSWPFHITLAQTVCNFGVTMTPASCAPSVDVTSKFTAADEELGSLTTEANADVVYTATNTDTLVQTVLTNGGTTQLADGTYTVAVALSAQGISDGVVLGGDTSFGPYTFTDPCLPTEASWNAGATATNAVCTSDSTTDGTITLEHDADQDGKVTYTITNDATSAVVYHGTNSTPGDTVVNVGAGHYTVTAVATEAGDGLSGSTNPDGSETFHLDVTLTGSDCDGNLAFTGGTIAWLGFVLAGGMLFLGFALLYMRRRGNRTAE